MLQFRAGHKSFQVPVAEVERILSLQRQAVSPIPFGLGKSVEGLFSFRGVALPLLRIAGGQADEASDKGNITVILLGTGVKRFGIAVDSASTISEAIDPDAISVCAQSLYEGSVAGL